MVMKQVGLEYSNLGQSTSTLYLIDEPTTGLHPQEVEKLLHILRKLVSKGNTVVMIEHHLDAICEADTIIDFGRFGGIQGGEIVARGTLQEVAAHKGSLTGQCLKAYLGL